MAKAPDSPKRRFSIPTRPSMQRTGSLILGLEAPLHNSGLEFKQTTSEVLMEASWTRGRAGEESFKLFSTTTLQPAPALKNSSQGWTGVPDSPQQQYTAACCTTPASCLATPRTLEKNLGEVIQAALRKLSVQADINAQIRYLDEVRKRVLKEEEEDNHKMRQQGAGMPNRRRKRRSRVKEDGSRQC
ncbi:hypothetical protein WJX72_005860 [[Myrmecia] bisecta]|uniref:Uncharacterized protein n=1 Tax=[Myrmecia] bisecta TaxID=41462 RepID=A0AAW1PJX4_9CHLO